MKSELRDIKKEYVLAALTGLVLGILFLVFPETSERIVCYLVAGVVTLFGLLRLIAYFAKREPEYIFRYDLAIGLLALAAGIFLFFRPEVLQGVLAAALGVAVVVDSVFKLQNAFDFARVGYRLWWVALLLALATAALGVMILANPFETAAVLLMFLGISLVADALIDFWCIFFLARGVKRFRKALEKPDAAVADAKAADDGR